MKKVFCKKVSVVITMALVLILIMTSFSGIAQVHAASKMVRVSTEKALNKAVKDKSVTSIIFRTKAYINVTIKANKAASSKDLTIDAPNADITNKSVFSGIFLESSGNYVENASGNTFEIYDDYAVKGFTVEKKKTVKAITFYNPSQNIDRFYTIRKDAKIEKIDLIYSDGGNVSYGVYNEQTRTIEFNYVNKYDTDISLTYTFDNSGRVLNFKNHHPEFGCEYSYEYDANGNMIKESFSDLVGVGYNTYEYTSDFKLAKVTYVSEMEQGVVNYNYDKKGNLISLERYNEDSGESKIETEYTYDKKGRMLTCTEKYTGTTVIKYKYNKKGFLTSYSYQSKGGVVTEYKYSATYKYNKNGDMIKETINENGRKTVNKYSFDEYGYRN